MKVLMLAAENGALPHGKVGGMGDVIRDLPPAIVDHGHEVTVLTPGYGTFSRLPGAVRVGTLSVPFGGATERVDRYRIPSGSDGLNFECLEHARFAVDGPGRIYRDDGMSAPFFSDATKFAFFSAAGAAAALETVPDIVHLHDWHVGNYFALRKFDRRFARLADVRTVFTIHNLALQGIRPFDETESSWRAWYPWLRCDRKAIADPRYSGCINPMAIALRHADSVAAVSPTYAEEIVRPDLPERGFHGGEGLESELARAAREGRLTGILNGCDYTVRRSRRPGWKKLIELAEREVHSWIAAEVSVRSSHFLALGRLGELPRRRPRALLTSIGRVVPQKSALFLEPVPGASSALEAILDFLDAEDLFVMVGSGDGALEHRFRSIANRRENFLFLNGYSEALADSLYSSGDLFLMPSSYEPCGISQMLAMRAGQPCVVHGVGGLKDTVSERTGFVFSGESPAKQAEALVAAAAAAISLKREGSPRWDALRAAAAAARFDWSESARRYIEDVYLGDAG